MVRVGLGWGSSNRRQSLPDWHLDKLTALNHRALFISAIENTHQVNYITEKLFDALACGGIPLYWASDEHRSNKFVESGAYVNLYGLSVDDACSLMNDFSATMEFAESYQESQKRLADLFCNSEILQTERMRFVGRLFNALSEPLKGE